MNSTLHRQRYRQPSLNSASLVTQILTRAVIVTNVALADGSYQRLTKEFVKVVRTVRPLTDLGSSNGEVYGEEAVPH